MTGQPVGAAIRSGAEVQRADGGAANVAKAVGRSLPEEACRGCGTVGPMAVLAYPDGGGPVCALCATCARDRAHLFALIVALGTPPVLVVVSARPSGTTAAPDAAHGPPGGAALLPCCPSRDGAPDTRARL